MSGHISIVYKPVVIDCMIPEAFPSIALYMRSQTGNYTLYKPQDMPFTERHFERLRNNNVKTIYIHAGDSAEVGAYLEDNLAMFMADDDMPAAVKNVILQQISMEFVTEALKTPDGVAGDMKRCKTLIKNLMTHITSSEAMLTLMKELTAQHSFIMSHSVQVALLSMLLHGKLYEIDRDEMVEVGIGGIFHDIGMTFLTGNLSEDPDSLSDIDWKKSQLHPTIGHEFLAKNTEFGPIALEIVKHHHERWDGCGFPDKLKGNNISRSAQITAACDIYSLLTNKRTYRKASTPQEALEILHAEINGYFSAAVYGALVELVTPPPAAAPKEQP